MKISEIENESVRERAVQHAMNPEMMGRCESREEALDRYIGTAFSWNRTNEGGDFWFDIDRGKDLPIPESAQEETRKAVFTAEVTGASIQLSTDTGDFGALQLLGVLEMFKKIIIDKSQQ